MAPAGSRSWFQQVKKPHRAGLTIRTQRPILLTIKRPTCLASAGHESPVRTHWAFVSLGVSVLRWWRRPPCRRHLRPNASDAQRIHREARGSAMCAPFRRREQFPQPQPAESLSGRGVRYAFVSFAAAQVRRMAPALSRCIVTRRRFATALRARPLPHLTGSQSESVEEKARAA